MITQTHSKELHDLSVKLKGLREIFKLSQTGFANMLGVSRSQIAGIEQERHSPSLEMMFRLCDVFNITPAELGVYMFSTGKIKACENDRLLAHKYLYNNIEKLLVEEAIAKAHKADKKKR